MYKCRECGAEYDKKPDYCDCGNDEFEEIISFNKTEETLSSNQTDKKNEGIVYEAPIQQSEIKPSEFVPKKKQSFEERYPVLYDIINSIEPISAFTFIVCIALSFYVILFAWNPKYAEDITVGTVETKTVVNIPNIDKFWDNTPPKTEPKEAAEPVKHAEVIPQVVKKFVSVPKTVTTQSKQITQNKMTQTKTQTKPKTTTVPLQKVTQTQKKTATVNKSAEEQAKKAQEAAKIKAAEMAAAEAQAKKLAEEQARKAAEVEKARRSAAAKQELVNYKANLRNTLGRKIDFTKVIGDGSCVVAFKIDQNGKLINRSFAQQSTNITLNDAVYKAIMSTPSYNPPPSAYNNEILNLNIKFYNGNFEISLH